MARPHAVPARPPEPGSPPAPLLVPAVVLPLCPLTAMREPAWLDPPVPALRACESSAVEPHPLATAASDTATASVICGPALNAILLSRAQIRARHGTRAPRAAASARTGLWHV